MAPPPCRHSDPALIRGAQVTDVDVTLLCGCVRLIVHPVRPSVLSTRAERVIHLDYC